VWGVIWLIIAFLFFILGVFVGLIAFKVRFVPVFFRHVKMTRVLVTCLGIDCAARTGCEALLAYARLEQCIPASDSCATGTARRHAVVRGSRVAVIPHVDGYIL
jgi:hypothetical protein